MNFRDLLIFLSGLLLRALFPQRPPPQPFQPRSLLVLRACCLGDILLATAAVAQLRAALPDVHLAFAVGRFARAAIENNPHVDEVIECGDVGVPRFALRDYLAFVRLLRRRRFDAAIVLDRSPLMGLIPFWAGIPVRIGLDSQGRGFAHTLRVPVPPGRHHAELFLDLVRALGFAVQDRRLHFHPTAEDRGWAAERLSGGGGGSPEGAPWVALAPGGGVNPGTVLLRKRWPMESYAALARRFLEESWRVVLLGDRADRGAATRVRTLLQEGPSGVAGLLDLTEQTTWGQLAAVLEGCSLLVGGDSGPLHLAMAVGTPTIGLYGPTDPALDGPFGPTPHAIVYRALECSPCFVDGRFLPTRPQADCLLGITVEEVWEEVKKLLSSGAVPL